MIVALFMVWAAGDATASDGVFGFSGTEIASIFVAVIAAGSAFAAQRSAARASMANTSATTRTDIEKEAYTRAEGFLDGTIKRQDEELKQARVDIDDLRADLKGTTSDLDEEIRQHRVTKATLAEFKTENATMARQIQILTEQVAELRVRPPQL